MQVDSTDHCPQAGDPLAPLVVHHFTTIAAIRQRNCSAAGPIGTALPDADTIIGSFLGIGGCHLAGSIIVAGPAVDRLRNIAVDGSELAPGLCCFRSFDDVDFDVAGCLGVR